MLSHDGASHKKKAPTQIVNRQMFTKIDCCN